MNLLFLLPLAFLFKRKTTDTKKLPLTTKVKEKLKQGKAIKSLEFLGFRIKNKNFIFRFRTNTDLQVDNLKISILDKNKNVIETYQKSNFKIEKNKIFILPYRISISSIKLIRAKYIMIELKSGGVTSKTIKRIKILSLV